jgi:rhodanese-related sulfurtransferase
MVNSESIKTFRNRAVIFIFLLCGLPTTTIAAGWQLMTPQRAYSLVREGSGLWLVDVRSRAAFEERHIEGAVHIAAGTIAAKRFPRQKIIVLVDDALGLRRARESAATLLKHGLEKVYVLDGGMTGWQAEGLAVAGMRGGRIFCAVMPDEIKWAQDNRIPLRIFDLREEGERAQGPIVQARAVEGDGLLERLNKVKEMIAMPPKEGLAAKLEKSAPIILIFPITADPRPLLEWSFRDFPGDVRFLEGGFAAWAAKPEKRITTAPGACPTCPGGTR